MLLGLHDEATVSPIINVQCFCGHSWAALGTAAYEHVQQNRRSTLTCSNLDSFLASLSRLQLVCRYYLCILLTNCFAKIAQYHLDWMDKNQMVCTLTTPFQHLHIPLSILLVQSRNGNPQQTQIYNICSHAWVTWLLPIHLSIKQKKVGTKKNRTTKKNPSLTNASGGNFSMLASQNRSKSWRNCTLTHVYMQMSIPWLSVCRAKRNVGQFPFRAKKKKKVEEKGGFRHFLEQLSVWSQWETGRETVNTEDREGVSNKSEL